MHPSLRRYIPDDIFRGLVSHQLDHPGTKQRWSRVSSLLKFAQSCGVAAGSLGRDFVERAVSAGMEYVLGPRTDADGHTHRVLNALWQTLDDMCKGDWSGIGVETREMWLRYRYRRVRDTAKVRLPGFLSAVEQLVEHNGAEGLGERIGRIFNLIRTPHNTPQILERVAWCASRNVDIPPEHISSIMLAYTNPSPTATNSIDVQTLPTVITRICTDLGVAPGSPAHSLLSDCVGEVQAKRRSPAEKAADLPETADTPSTIRHALAMFKRNGKPPTPEDLEAALTILERLASRPDAEFSILVDRLVDALHPVRYDEPDRIIRLARVIMSHEPTIFSPTPLHRMFILLISALPSDQAYALSRSLYAVVRSLDPPFKWSHTTRDSWRSLFHHAIHRTRRHHHFASRLYADIQADELVAYRTDALAMIRSIGMSKNDSRPILLERHVKDYLWMEYGSPNAFVSALVKGLTSTGDTEDASLALYLARRLLEGQPLPDRAAELVVRQLAASPQEKHQRQCREILVSLPPSPTTSALYDHVLSATITFGRTRAASVSEDVATPREDALVHAVEIYRLMIYQGVTPTARTRSLLIRALVNAKRLDVALDVFHACMSDKMAVKSNAVGSLMTALATVGRLDDAESVETKWRTLADKHSKARNYDRGVVGAKVLVDLLRGKDVDLDRVARKTGWKPNTSFARFLESVRESQSESPSHSTGLEPFSSGVDPEVEGGDQRSPGGAEFAEQGSKRRIIPPTWSWIDEEAPPVMEDRKVETRSADSFQNRLRMAGDN
ncbi:hypothetical protein JCM24511_02852 [Saitozyma sp. JCM 24511]|nr:hypothetical protein JCM24511_02852 [Saitozyma sp. JCM 24511]